jgi:two-component system NtrC family sensor kinase
MLIRIETESSELSAPGRMLITPSDVKLRIASERVPRADGSGAEDDTLYLVLRYGARVFGVVVGRGVREAPTGHAELLCRITSAALQNLELIRSTLVNEKLAVLGRVMAAVAHEVNNPLTFVLANLRSLEAELDGNHREAATEAREGAERVGRIIGDLSSLSRSGQQVYPVRADLGALAREAARMARVRCPGGTVTVTIDAAGPAEISGDPNRLIQVLVNLIVNGLDAARGGESPRVEVRIHADDQGHVLVDVADSGPGIARSVLPRLFEAFFTTKGEEGTGLGLFISRSLARAHGGDLVLESTESGGSVFRLSLPRAEPTHEPEADAASMQTPSPAPRDPTPQPGFAERPSILVIDDEASLVRGLERWLGRWADVTGTTDARKGLELAASCKYDLVLCDLDMPHMNGREVLRALQESNPAAAARLVLMTGSSSVSAPDIKVLRKPIEEDAIKRLIVELRSRLAASSTAAE